MTSKIEFRKQILRLLNNSKLNIGSTGTDLDIIEGIYCGCKVISFDSLCYTNFSKFDLIDIGWRMAWLKLFLIMSKITKPITIIMEENTFGEDYWDLPILIQESLHIRNIKIPLIDKHSNFLRSCMFKFLEGESKVKINKIYHYEDNNVHSWGLILK